MQGQPGLQREFQDRWGYTEKPRLEKTKQPKNVCFALEKECEFKRLSVLVWAKGSICNQCLPQKLEGLSSDFQRPCTKLGVVAHVCNHSIGEKVETSRFLELISQPDQPVNSGFTERLFFKR